MENNDKEMTRKEVLEKLQVINKRMKARTRDSSGNFDWGHATLDALNKSSLLECLKG